MSDNQHTGALGAAELEQWIIAGLAARLRIDPRAIDRRERFNRYGLDSVKATAFTGELAARLGKALPPTLMWDHPSVEKLVKHLTAPSTATAPAAQTGSKPATARAAARPTALEPIAVVGIACRFPQAPDPAAYWRLLSSGVDAIAEVPRDRWDLGELFDADVAVPGKMNTRWGGFLDQVDRFDAQAFAISPREAAQMDPQQRLILELCSEALDDAGVKADRLRGSATGVFIGAMWSDYARLVAGDASCITQHTATGQDTSIIAGRVSYVYGVQGPSLTVNTACSSSLVAAHLACQSLRLGESTLALVGGVSLVLSPESTVAMSKFGAMAADGRSKAFDARANGYVRGEGGGVIVLKPLSRALADGDSIYCLITGSAMNNDGFSNGLTAPNPQAQENVLRAAYANAGLATDQVQYVEAHGTGTLLGDPIEAGALGAVLGSGRPIDRPLMLGSVKTNIGHLEAAAGMAGLIKVALSVRHGLIPPSLHFQTPNPHIRFDDLRLRVQTKLGPWPNEDEPPSAGVSSFGFGGTNCHVVVQGLPESRARLLTLTTGSGADLTARARTLSQDETLADAPGHLCVHDAGDVRAAVVFNTAQDLRRKLAGLAEGTALEGVAIGSGAKTRGGIVFVCSGHGSQWPGMTRTLLQSEPVFRAKLEECAAAIEAVAGWKAIDELVADPAISRVEQFDITQPLLFAISVSLAALWRSWGIEPDAVVGHSMGEVAAACVAGALSIEDAAQVICHRSRLLARMVGQGSIAILGLSREEVERKFAAYSDRVWVAACNGPATTAVSGDPVLLQEIVSAMQAENQFARLANAGVPAHSPKVDPLRAELFESVHAIAPRHNPVRMYSTVTAAAIGGSQLGPSYWVRNLREPVLFAQAVDAAIKDGCDTFVELSPHPVLSTGIEQSLAKSGLAGVVVPSGRRNEDERRVMLESAAKLFASCRDLALTLDERDPQRVAAAAAVPVVLSAYAPAALPDSARTLAAFLRQRADVSLLDVAQTTTRRRTHQEHRVALVASTREGLVDALDAFARGEERTHTTAGRAGDAPPRVAFVFCGHGPQWWAMGRELLKAEPLFRDAIERCDRLIKRHADWSLVEELGRGETDSKLDRLDIAQPAIFSMQVAITALWKSWGVAPVMVAGHSMGEVAAAHAAGVLSLEDAVRIIVQRGRLVQRSAGKGRMAAVELSAADAVKLIEPYGDRVAVAAVNGPLASVLSGEPSAIGELVRAVEARGVFARELRVDFASHCAQMDPIVPELVSMLDGISPAAATVPIYSTVTGKTAEGWEFDATYWGRNTRQPVLFAQAFDAMLAAGVDVVIEIGPHPVLAAPMTDCARERGLSPVLLASLRRDQPERATMLASAGALHTLGGELAWAHVVPPGGHHVSLPPYAWQRERHWLGPVRRTAAVAALEEKTEKNAPASDLSHWFYDVAWRAFDAQAAGESASASWMPAVGELNPASEAGTPPVPAALSLFRDLAFAYAVKALRETGIVAGDRLSPQALAGRFGVVENHERMFNRVLEILEAHGVVERSGGFWLVKALPAKDPAPLCAAIREKAAVYEPELTLLERCGSRLRDVLRGECDALELLFPDGSTKDAERLYEQATFSKCHNERIQAALEAIVSRRPAGRKLRVLEIGAGTGATTRYALGALPAGSVEYVFTDASPMFLSRAKEKFAQRGDITYATLDIETDPASQGFAAGSFDVVIAANVVHATRDLRRTLSHISRVLADGGLVMLLEGIKAEPWVDLIFGLTSGWWRFGDTSLRPSHPLLSGEQWLRTLPDAGFGAAEVCADRAGESLFAQAVVIGQTAPRSTSARDWLILADRGEDGEQFASIRRAQGDRATVIAHEDGTSLAAIRAIDAAWVEPAIDQNIRNVVYLCGPAGADAPEAAALDRCATVLAIAQRLVAKGAGAPRLWIVTRAAEHVEHGERPAIEQSPLWGLARVLALEHPQVWGGIVDTGRADGLAAAAAIVGRAGSEDQIAVRADAAYVARLEDRPHPATAPLQLKADATYLITGGLGNLGLKVARWMIERGARHLVLVGRRGRNDSGVRDLEAAGATIEIVRADVSDAGSTVALIERLAGAPYPLKGIIHAAGVSVRKPLVELSRADFESDFAPKVNGAWLLHRATRGLTLDFFVMFSSAAAIWASRDMASYASANHFMDALAYDRRAQGLPALSVNWGRWDEVGVTGADAHALWDRIGLRRMPEQASLDALERLMVSGATAGTVADVEWQRFKALHETRAVRPFLKEVGQAVAAEPAAAAPQAETLSSVLAASTPEERLVRLTALVHGEVCSILGLDPTRALDPARGFAQMGLDSLMAIDLRNRLQKALGRSLPSPVVFNYSSVRALAGYLATGGSEPALTAPAKAEAAATEPRTLAATEIHELSDEEAEALLATRVAALGRDGV